MPRLSFAKAAIDPLCDGSSRAWEQDAVQSVRVALIARILLLHQYFPPDTVITGRQAQVIASALAHSGHEVSAIVGQPSYGEHSTEAPRREIYEAISVRRVRMPFRGRKRRSTRFAGYLAYLFSAALLAIKESPDAVVSFHIPPFVPGLALLVAKIRGAIFVYVPQDIHPDILVESQWLKLPGPLLSAWDAFNHLVLSHADHVVALGEGMRRTLVDKGAHPERTSVIPLWGEPAFAVLGRDDGWREQHGLSPQDLVVLVAGNMGLMHPLDQVLAAAAGLETKGIRVVIAGDGVLRSRWVAQVQRGRLDHVMFLPFQRGDAFRSLVAAADVALVTLAHGMERLAVPSRPYAMLAAGRPVVAMTSPTADIAVAVRSHGAGWHVNDAGELRSLLCALAAEPARIARAGASARDLYESYYTSSGATGRYVQTIDALLK